MGEIFGDQRGREKFPALYQFSRSSCRRSGRPGQWWRSAVLLPQLERRLPTGLVLAASRDPQSGNSRTLQKIPPFDNCKIPIFILRHQTYPLM